MNRFCIINQPAGLGDICFCQKIAVEICQKYGCEVIWPVINEFLWIQNYIKTPGVTFTSKVDLHSEILPRLANKHNKIEWLDLQTADQHYPNESVMLAKYKYAGIDWSNWSEYFKFERNHQKEDELYKKLVGDTQDYIFVNRNYGSPPNYVQCKYIDMDYLREIYPHYKIIEMNFLEGYTLFDWSKILENAGAIHTAETSLNYIMEKLDIRIQKYIYSKHTPPSFNHVDMLFTGCYYMDESALPTKK